ncbi:copper amine oxidase N-terminal domain-containing protein [Paenibacillus sp. MSJ-34]|uniref:copper amine oxidase N-terminal domain-containing protein n=1 Tax=Paenibacillus sp. MSJ-34 TaxID=2841529 RepID=UPI001C11951B|nr:copper amine oxidase N-terminal domain-containing protein [Paenibacillus sp. MSJ-34]MBU5444863.1 copper amine oxidase N-terminal domain-containing protein [Paenibacillus sp. MSJ-34]
MNKWPLYFVAILLSFIILIPAAYASQVQVTVDGQLVSFPDEPPYIDRTSGRTMVPVKFISDKLGATMKWNKALQQVVFSYKKDSIMLTIGQNYALVNGKKVPFDVPAEIRNNRTMVPLRFISEVFHAEVDWNPDRNLVSVVTAKAKGTWIWNSSLIETEPDNVLRFAADNGVTNLYLQIDTDMASKTYAEFIRRAQERQIQVEALAGRPDWAYRSKREQMRKLIGWVGKYNASVAANERFEGLHFDIEPYLLPEWKTDRNALLEQWMDNARWIEQETKGSGLTVTFDVPFWLHTVKIPETDYSFSAWLLEKFDRLVIMDYRNVALGKDGIVENADAIMREASTLRKQVIVAVETAQNSESDRASFYSMSVEAMEKELQTAHRKLARYSSYAGLAIHDYPGWVAMHRK